MKKLLALVLCLLMLVPAFAMAEANTELTAHLRVLYPGTSDLEKEIADDIAICFGIMFSAGTVFCEFHWLFQRTTRQTTGYHD